MDFLDFLDLDFHLRVTDFFKNLHKLRFFFVWSCVANLFKMPAKSNYIFVIIPHSWVFLIKTKCGFCCFLWKHTAELDYGVGNVNKTENMEFARSDIGQEWIICQIW